MMNNQLTAPTRIPHDIMMAKEKEAPVASFGVAGSDFGSSNGAMGSLFGDTSKQTVKVGRSQEGDNLRRRHDRHADCEDATDLSADRQGGARAGYGGFAGDDLQDGSIENLQVVSGPAMLQQAALDAVKTWRYRPYLLNNEPVEVDTTVNVIFTLGG